MRAKLWFGAWCWLVWLVGCVPVLPPPVSQSDSVDVDGAAKPPTAEASKTVATEVAGVPPVVLGDGPLPELDDPLPPLGDGRVVVRPPKDWYVVPRNPSWLARFQTSRTADYPAVFVLRPTPYKQLENVDSGNVEQFATARRAAFEADVAAGRIAFRAGPSVVTFGQHHGIAYVRPAVANLRGTRVPIERLFLETVHDGQLITVELRTREGELDQHRAVAVAVAAGLKFLAAEEAQQQVEAATAAGLAGDGQPGIVDPVMGGLPGAKRAIDYDEDVPLKKD